MLFKLGIVHSNIKIVSSFIHSYVVPNLTSFCETRKKIPIGGIFVVHTMEVDVNQNILFCVA